MPGEPRHLQTLLLIRLANRELNSGVNLWFK